MVVFVRDAPLAKSHKAVSVNRTLMSGEEGFYELQKERRFSVNPEDSINQPCLLLPVDGVIHICVSC